MKYGLTVIITLTVFVLAAIGYVWSGVYNIAATEPHWNITTTMIDTLRNRSIAAHSSDASNPDVPQVEPAAFSHYHEMCRLCHGAPEYPPAEFARGLYPVPPSMTSGSIQQARSDSEIYWIVKHGIKMTGMPAFGPTHDENALKGLVALVKDIPRMDPAHYRHGVSEAGEGAHEHMHGEMEGATGQNHGDNEHEEHENTEEGHH